MKSNVIALAIAGVASLCAVNAHAIQELTGAEAVNLQLSESGAGHMLLVPYFSTQNGNASLLSLINMDETNGKAVKVRFRGALNGDSVYDLQVFLAPGDVWTANVSQNAAGLSYLTTADNSCTKPAAAIVNATPFSMARLNPNDTALERANGTREGYIEIINMADIPPQPTGVFPLITHAADGKATCADTASNSSWTALDVDMRSETAIASYGLARPSTGLAANWSIFNVPKALSWGGNALAFDATSVDIPVRGNVAYFPQSDTPAPKAALYSADPLFAGNTAQPSIVAASMRDLPDMSTPYLNGVVNPYEQAKIIADALSVKSVANEFWTDKTIEASTDWLFTAPTKRFSVGVDYKSGATAAVFNSSLSRNFNASNIVATDRALCVATGKLSVRDRETLDGSAADEDLTSTNSPNSFCGATSVLGFGGEADGMSPVLSANVANQNIKVAAQNGWFKMGTLAKNSVGIPFIGLAFAQAYNPQVSAGTSGNFGVTWQHRMFRR